MNNSRTGLRQGDAAVHDAGAVAPDGRPFCVAPKSPNVLNNCPGATIYGFGEARVMGSRENGRHRPARTVQSLANELAYAPWLVSRPGR